MKETKIQTIFYRLSGKTEYWMKAKETKETKETRPKRISKKEWFRLYDISSTVVLGPLTKEAEEEEEINQTLDKVISLNESRKELK